MKYFKLEIASAFARIGENLMILHKTDLLYELPNAIDHLEQGKDFILFVRSTGADSIERFMKTLDNDDEKTYYNAVRKAQITLGVEYVIWFSLGNDGHIRLTFRSNKEDLPILLKDELTNRGIKYEFIKGLW
jgi:hypothetical protein